jgi:pyruvate,orthophosphate dikinase
MATTKKTSRARKTTSSSTSSRKKATPRRKSAATSKRPAKMVYFFGGTRTEGKASQKTLLGGKGANLADMTSIGLPVPAGFTITTNSCEAYYDVGGRFPEGLSDQIRRNVRKLEQETGKKFGSTSDPLLVSVRSGAAVSMPGMMDTVLNLGLNDRSVEGLATLTGNERFAWDAYRRLINMYGDVVMGVDHHHFEAAFDKIKRNLGVTEDTDVPAEGLRDLCTAYKAVYKQHVGAEFPSDPFKQLELAVEAVFKSWHSDRAISYRRINEISGLNGTAVNVQAMVFGNMGEDSGTGVAFTRDPSTGRNYFYGEFLINAQGEDVVAGIRTPEPLAAMAKWNARVAKELDRIRIKLEKHYKDMQDIEFTIERGKLYMLQTRNGKRTGAAAVKMAVDMVKERLITRKVALKRIPANDLTQLLLPSFPAKAKASATTIARGLPASPGAASGALAFTADEAVERSRNGEQVLLVRKETSPEDVDGMHSAAGILTSTGGMTSHAAVVARGWGKCCVAGAGEISIDAAKGRITVDGKTYDRKSVLSIDGATGEVMIGEIERVVPSKVSGDLATVLKWADDVARMGVRTNADTPKDAKRAREFGAIGIGLCRTEHMFFEGDRIKAMREMILADTTIAREKALKKLLPYQRKDFAGIFTAMKGLPVTVRLLDPPLHEFLPHEVDAQKAMAKDLGVPFSEVKRRVSMLHEMNPMLGHRGCRLAITYPEIAKMQARAITEATIQCLKKGVKARPEIMVPLIGTRRELEILRELILETIATVKREKKYQGKLDIPVGTMIEIPRAALTAGEVAEVADFFSFGTNDLTQMAFGYSRDDAGVFLPEYVTSDILEKDPFQSIDTTGVGRLVDIACREGRATVPGLKLGICGEHGGDPASIAFCEQVGLDYVSCSPFRVPVARLAAAQAVL